MAISKFKIREIKMAKHIDLNNLANLNEKLIFLIKKSELSVKELSQKAKVSRSVIYRILNRTASLSLLTVVKLKNALGTTLKDVFTPLSEDQKSQIIC